MKPLPAVLAVILLLHPLLGLAWDKSYHSSYLLGDSDSRLSARRAAILLIQQQAIQEAGVYIQGHSVLHNQVLDEKIEQITAAMVRVEVLSEQFVVESNGQQRLELDAHASVDESVLAERVRSLQQQNQHTDKLQALADANQLLQQKLDVLLQQQQAILPLLPSTSTTPKSNLPAAVDSSAEQSFWGQ